MAGVGGAGGGVGVGAGLIGSVLRKMEGRIYFHFHIHTHIRYFS